MVKTLNVFLSRKESTRLLRDSHLDLKIETRKENSHLILNLDSQFCCENSHSHSQLSFSNSQKFETSRLNLVDFSGNFSNISLQFWCFNYKDFNIKSHKRCTLSLNQTLNLENWESHSQFQSHFPPSELSFSFSTLNFSPRTLILILDFQKFPWEVSFSTSTPSKLTLAEVWKVELKSYT